MSRLLIALALALSSLALPVTAHADMWTGVDEQGDVVAYDSEASDPCGTGAAAPDEESADLTRVGFKHRKHSVLLRATLRDLRLRGVTVLGFYVDTPGRAYLAEFDRFGREFTSTFLAPIPRAFLGTTCEEAFGTSDETTSSSRPGRRCRDPRAEILGDTVRLHVLRRCLDNPAWVRIGVYGFTGDDEETRLALDTWTPAGQEPTGFVIGALSPRIKADR